MLRAGVRAILALTVLVAAPIAYSDIPDEIDYAKYYKLFEAQKKISDEARRVANEKYAIYEQRRAEREELENRRASILAQIQQDQYAISRLESENQSLSYERQNISNYQIPNVQRQMQNNRSQASSLDQQISSTSAALSHEQDPQRRAALESQLNSLYASRRNLDNEYNSLSAEQSRLYSRMNQIDGEINSNYSRISSLQREISSLYAQLPSEEQINSARARENQAYSVYKQYDAVARAEEQKTSEAQKAYEKVYDRFQVEKSKAILLAEQDGLAGGKKEASERASTEAQNMGRSDGDRDGKAKGVKEGTDRDYKAGFDLGTIEGPRDGAAKGDKDGRENGTSDGKDRGYAEGLLAGFNKGHDRGYNEMYPVGYQEGNNQENYQHGMDEGLVKGAADARTTAASEDYPRGRKDQIAEIEAEAPAQTLVIDNGSIADKFGISKDTASSRPSRVAARSLFALGSIPVPPTPTPDYRYRNYKTYQHPELTAAHRNTYDEAYNKSFKKSYEAVFPKAYQENYESSFNAAYQNALAQSYDQARKSGYDTAYKPLFEKAYAESRQKAYDAAYADAFKASYAEGLPVREAEGYEKGKDDGLAKGRADGGKDAYTRGFTKGQSDGYAANIDAERRNAYEAGRADVRKEYENNFEIGAQVSAVMDDVNGDGFVGLGEKLILQVTVRNFGSREAPAGQLSVQVEDINKTLKPGTVTAALKSLPGKAKGTFTNILRVQVVDKIDGKDTVLVKIHLLSDGKEVGVATVKKHIWPFSDGARDLEDESSSSDDRLSMN